MDSRSGWDRAPGSRPGRWTTIPTIPFSPCSDEGTPTMNVNLKSLVGKLNPEARGALEAAAGLCLSRTHYDVEIEHYLMKLLEKTDGDAAAILKHFGVDRSRLSTELTRSLDKLKSGNARNPTISPSVVKMFSEAWLLASVDLGDSQVRTGHTILALVANEELSRMANEMSKEFAKIQPEALRKDFEDV